MDSKKQETDPEKAKQRLRLLVYTSLIGCGVAGLCVSASAGAFAMHGNASSNGHAELSWNLNDFVVKKDAQPKKHLEEHELQQQRKDPNAM